MTAQQMSVVPMAELSVRGPESRARKGASCSAGGRAFLWGHCLQWILLSLELISHTC